MGVPELGLLLPVGAPLTASLCSRAPLSLVGVFSMPPGSLRLLRSKPLVPSLLLQVSDHHLNPRLSCLSFCYISHKLLPRKSLALPLIWRFASWRAWRSITVRLCAGSQGPGFLFPSLGGRCPPAQPAQSSLSQQLENMTSGQFSCAFTDFSLPFLYLLLLFSRSAMSDSLRPC